MTPEAFRDKYWLATGREITVEIARDLLNNPGKVNQWLIKQVLKMAEPTKLADLAGEYTTQINPIEHEGTK